MKHLQDKGLKQFFIISPVNKLQMIFDRLEIAFNTEYEENLYDYGIVKIVLLLFYRNEDLKSIGFYQKAIELLSENEKYRFLTIMCNFVIYFIYIENNEIHLADDILGNIISILRNLKDDELEFIWAWISKRSKIFMPIKYNTGLEKIFNKIKIYPKNEFTKIFRAIHYYKNGQIRKAKNFLIF